MLLLPVIKIDISSQSRGLIRGTTDNVPITTIISGRITWLPLKNNAIVQKGDTLIKIAKLNLETEKNTHDTSSSSTNELLSDISDILSNKRSGLRTSAAREDYFRFQSRKNELQSKVSQAQLNFNRNKILYNKDIIAIAEYEKFEYELRFASQALQSYIGEQKVAWKNQKRDLQQRIKKLKRYSC